MTKVFTTHYGEFLFYGIEFHNSVPQLHQFKERAYNEVGLASSLTEDQWDKICDAHNFTTFAVHPAVALEVLRNSHYEEPKDNAEFHRAYLDYATNNYTLETAKESGMSLLAYLGMDATTTMVYQKIK